MTNPQTEPIRKDLLPCTPPAEWEFHSVFGARSDTGGVALFPGDAGPVVIRRRVTYGDWEPVRPDRWAEEPPSDARAAVPVSSPPPDQTLRDRIRALHQPVAGEGDTKWCQVCSQEERQPDPVGWWVPWPCPTVQAVDETSEAAVPPPPADRAAVLREAADELDAMLAQVFADWPSEPKDSPGVRSWREAVSELRRLAAEAQPEPGPGADLIEDYLRFLRGQGPEPDLSDLPDEQREAVAGQFEIVRALADRDPNLPPLDRDPVARRLGLHAADAEVQQSECPASTSGSCLREAESETACDTEAGECVHGGRPAAGAQQPATETCPPACIACATDESHDPAPPAVPVQPAAADTGRIFPGMDEQLRAAGGSGEETRRG